MAAPGPMLVWSRTARHGRLGWMLAGWHLLSLDAPTVAALWCWYIARCARVALPWTSMAAMFTAVWMLYAADRLLDVRGIDARGIDARGIDARGTDARIGENSAPGTQAKEKLEERHRFHHRHSKGFLAGIAVASCLLIWLLLPMPAQALRLYALLASLLVAWFLLIHVLPASTGAAGAVASSGAQRRLPKELAVGVFFPAAVFIPTIARSPALRLPLLPAALLLSAVCLLNCLWIYRWEHPDPRVRAASAHITTRLATAHLRGLTLIVLAVAGTIAGAALIWTMAEMRLLGPLALTCASAAGILLALDGMRTRMNAVVLRAAADLALLTPLLIVAGSLWTQR